MHFSRQHYLVFASLSCLSPLSFAQQDEQAINAAQCPLPSYINIGENIVIDDPDVIQILSQSSSIEKDNFAKFSGGVTLIGKDQRISANSVEVNRQSSLINANGDIHFQNKGLNVFASDLTASEQSKVTTLSGASYQLADSLAHGKAGQLAISQDGRLTLTDSTFTTCYGENPDWQLSASEIVISADENMGEAYHARFEIMDVPVLYIPYFTFPVNNERKSGFLYPMISSSSNRGVEIETPYYWNIQPNLDATITPRYMSKRGMQLNTEFRYLVDQQHGQIDIEYLNNDKELSGNNDARYLWRIQHTGNFSENFRAYVDYTSISDDAYLIDIGSQHYNSNDTYLYQLGELAYFSDNWNAKIKMQDFEILGNHTQSYKTVPQVEFSHFNDLGILNSKFELYSELSKFETVDTNRPEAERFHVEAGINVPIYTPAWFLNSEFKLLQTNYRQTRLDNSPELTRNVSRTLPKVRFHGGLNLERSTELFKQSFTQTLEPQIQYLYIPSRDQSEIGIYDTAVLQDDYEGLFRDRRFSGLDRIADANQYAWGLTSRFLDQNNLERMRFSLGRIVYLKDTQFNADNNDNVDESALAADAFVRINNNWQFSSNIQYNTDLDLTRNSQTSIDYHFGKNNVIQLNHRYTKNLPDVTLEQLSLLSSVRINKDWQFVGRVTQDLALDRSIESYAGFQYESCCWAVRIAYHRHINSSVDGFGIDSRDEFNSGFMIKFVLKGLTGQQSSISTQDMFNSSIFGYKRPYFLNN